MSYNPEIIRTDRRGIKMAYYDTIYGAPMPITCRHCDKHVTAGQYRQAHADDEVGWVWCSRRCQDAYYAEQDEAAARRRARGERAPDNDLGEPPQSFEEKCNQAAAECRKLDSGLNY